MKVRCTWSTDFQIPKDYNCRPCLTYPASFSVVIDGCGDFNENGSHGLYLNAWLLVSRTVREGLGSVACCLVRIDVALLEEMYHWR